MEIEIGLETMSRYSTDDAYAAGFFDGDGYIALTGNSRWGGRLQAGVVNNSEGVLVWLSTVYGGTVTRHSDRASRWMVSSMEDVANFLENIRPFLKIKFEEAEVALQWPVLGTKWNFTNREAIVAERRRIIALLKELRVARNGRT